jgi:hypothetical protein
MDKGYAGRREVIEDTARKGQYGGANNEPSALQTKQSLSQEFGGNTGKKGGQFTVALRAVFQMPRDQSIPPMSEKS